MTPAQVISSIEILQQRASTQRQAVLVNLLRMNQRYLRENSEKEGVMTLASGLQYSVMKSADASGTFPTGGDKVLVQYHRMLIDGSIFDSSVYRDESREFDLDQVIDGWAEALALMHVGDQWRLFIPPEMAYGEEDSMPAIPPNAALIFNLELLEIR